MAAEYPRGRIMRDDGQPLRTKIVATIGRPESPGIETTYESGILHTEGHDVTVREISYKWLVENFIDQGVDVIRLNLSHVPTARIAAVYSEVRKAILNYERRKRTDKRIAVLADLPGPKIRFTFPHEVPVHRGMAFTIRFTPAGDNAGLVSVDDHPLKEAMDAADDRLIRVADVEDDRQRVHIENIIGSPVGRVRARDTFENMINSISKRIGSDEGALVRIGDGDVVLRVKEIAAGGTALRCEVLTVKPPRESLSGRPGFAVKGVDLEIASFTTEDRQKLDQLLTCEYNEVRKSHSDPVLAFVGLSFTQTARDILRTKYFIDKKLRELLGSRVRVSDYSGPAVIAKIESQKGWLNRSHILDVADGLMVARGDLGLQMEIENVPAIQKRLIQTCNKRGKPVITATEMLKSMTDSVEPTRAEGTDVFNAILDGSDAVMMSEETSKGRFPLHSITKMTRIAMEAERYAELRGLEEREKSKERREKIRRAYREKFQTFFLDADEIITGNELRLKEISNLLRFRNSALGGYRKKHRKEIAWYRSLYEKKHDRATMQSTTDRITEATCTMSESDTIRAILAPTASGRTVRMIARMKPRVPVIGAAHDPLNTRKLIVSYGVWPICIGRADPDKGTEGMFQLCKRIITKDRRLKRLIGDGELIFTAGSPVETPGTTNLIQIKTCEESR